MKDEGWRMIKPATHAKIKCAFFDIVEDKVPGLSGYSLGFFKATWPIAEELTTAILEFFYSGEDS
ncbi:UNVERIFIED_CONTAM: hypothetical protein Sradi_5074900 [Sesamum radiatum]|uniref:Uncharacterized protein n=1 Tax=Sesamum radiatum TaxID=300843 RepID=A0AAW2M3J8_SESRA